MGRFCSQGCAGVAESLCSQTRQQVEMKSEVLDEVLQTYGVENWGAGYFEINSKGNLIVRPARNDPRFVDLKELIDALQTQRKLQVPILLRFPQILTNQLKRLCDMFHRAAIEFQYQGGHYPVFPMKVNPRREVVEELLRYGGNGHMGIE